MFWSQPTVHTCNRKCDQCHSNDNIHKGGGGQYYFILEAHHNGLTWIYLGLPKITHNVIHPYSIKRKMDSEENLTIRWGRGLNHWPLYCFPWNLVILSFGFSFQNDTDALYTRTISENCCFTSGKHDSIISERTTPTLTRISVRENKRNTTFTSSNTVNPNRMRQPIITFYNLLHNSDSDNTPACQVGADTFLTISEDCPSSLVEAVSHPVQTGPRLAGKVPPSGTFPGNHIVWKLAGTYPTSPPDMLGSGDENRPWGS